MASYIPQDSKIQMVDFKKGEQIEYLGFIPFILGNSQKFTYAGEIQEAISDINGQVELFRKPVKVVEGPTIDELHEIALLENEKKAIKQVPVKTPVIEEKIVKKPMK